MGRRAVGGRATTDGEGGNGRSASSSHSFWSRSLGSSFFPHSTGRPDGRISYRAISGAGLAASRAVPGYQAPKDQPRRDHVKQPSERNTERKE